MDDWSIYVGIIVSVLAGLSLVLLLRDRNNEDIRPFFVALGALGIGLLIIVLSVF